MINGKDILHVADSVAKEKNIDKSEVLSAIEVAIEKAARTKYGAEKDIRATLDHDTGEITLRKCTEVVDEVLDENTQISVADAQGIEKGVEAGHVFEDPLPPIDLGRVAAQTVRQVITQRVRDAEREHQFNEYKDHIGEIITGIVRRVEYGNLYIDLGRAEAIMRRDEVIAREHLRVGDRVRSYIREVREEARGPQIFLSRTAPEFMAELFKMEVPEIYDGVIEIKAVARDPGSRAKIGVISYDNSIDPVGACVGMRGSRVQAVVSELNGEKIDIIPWTEDGATFLVNALQPAEVAKVVMDEEAGRVEVVVPDEQLSLAIGRRGQNVRLASQLTGWDIDIMTEADESERRQAEFAERTKIFQDAMNVDEMVAQLLVSEGFSSLEEVAYVELDELTVIDGFDDATAEELQARARESLEEINAKALEKAKELGVEAELIEFDGLTPQMVLALAEDGILTLAEFGTCADWELAGGYSVVDGKRVKDDGLLEKCDVSLEEAQNMVMTARLQLGWVTIEELEAQAAAEAEAAEGDATEEESEA